MTKSFVSVDRFLQTPEIVPREGRHLAFSGGRISYVVRTNGDVIAPSRRKSFGGGAPNIMVGDTIVVPLDADRIRPLTLWASIAQIIYQLGLAAAAANAVGIFN
jgi:hypothetical protein